MVDCPIPEWPLDVYETQVLLASYAVTARWARRGIDAVVAPL